jgi:hypothetical protein
MTKRDNYCGHCHGVGLQFDSDRDCGYCDGTGQRKTSVDRVRVERGSLTVTEFSRDGSYTVTEYGDTWSKETI